MAYPEKPSAPELDTASSHPSRRATAGRSLHLLILLVLVAGVFGRTTGFDFVWDDDVLLVGVDAYERFDLGRMFFGLANQVEYLPIRDVSYAVDYRIWGQNPFGFHLSNLILYFLNVVLVYAFSLQLTARLSSGERSPDGGRIRAVALFTAALFAVHPLHCEAVSFISCRNVLLSGLFFFMTCSFFLTYLEHEGACRRTLYAASLLCCALAILSKATAVVLPGVLVLIAMLDGGRWPRTALTLVPFVAVAVAAVILFRTVAAQTGLIDPDQVIAFGSRSFPVRLAVALQIPFFYLGKLILPAGLSALYDTRFAGELTDPRVALAALGLLVAVAGAIRLRTRFPELLFALGWYLVSLLPVLNLFATGTVVSDRYAYLPSYAFAYLVATSLLRAPAAIPRLAIRFVAVVVIAALAFSAFVRNGVWRSDETLWNDTIRVSPDGRTAYYNLAVERFSRGEYEEAFDLLERLAERTGSDATLRLFRAQYAFDRGDPAATIALLEATPHADEAPFQIPYLLAQAYEASGNIQKAIEQYAAVLQAGGGHAGEESIFVARDRLARLQAKISPRFEAQRRAVQENPGDLNARAALAVGLERAGLYDEALRHYDELSRRGGESWILYYNMGNVYRKLGRYEEAVASYEKSASMNANHADTYNNLGVALKNLQAYDAAIRAFDTAMRIDPELASAPFNLAALYFRRGEREQAARLFDFVVRSFPELKGQADPYLKALR